MDRPENGLRHYIGIPFRVLRRFATSLAVLALVISLGFNLAALTISGVFTATSAVLSSAGLSTVAAREAAEKRAQRKATGKIARETARSVRTRVAKGAARNIASVGGEAIPVAGVAVIAAALAFDVKDACDTARDMAGLEAALDAETDPDAARQSAMLAFDCRSIVPSFEDLPDRETIFSTVQTAPREAWQGAVAQFDDLTEMGAMSAGSVWQSVAQGVTALPDFDDVKTWWNGPQEVKP